MSSSLYSPDNDAIQGGIDYIKILVSKSRSRWQAWQDV